MNEKQTKILTIDDDSGLRRTIRMFFEDLGFRVFESENGDDGLSVFRDTDPDIVLIDLRMPGKGGMEVTKILHREAPNVPLVVVSGTGVIDEVIEAIRIGAWDYVTKPINDMKILEHVVKRALERSRLLKENREYQGRLEDLVQKRTRELVGIQQKYQEIFNATSETIIIHDVEEGRILDMNQTMLDSFGYTHDQALGLSIEDISSGDPEFIRTETIRHIKQTAMEGPQVFEWHFRRNNGDLFWGEVTLKKIDVLGKKRILAVIRDITERKQAEEEKANLERQLRQTQKMEAIGSLAGGIAHDFNNILSVIFGHVDLIIDQFSKDGKTYNSLQRLRTAAERARELVSQILTFSRQTDHEYSLIKPQYIINEALKLIRPSIPTTIQIRSNVEKDEGKIYADPVQIHQIVMNLCTNAYHAMRENGGTLFVGLKPVQLTHEGIEPTGSDPDQKSFFKLIVQDTGIGIDETMAQKIFDPYFTTKKKGEGTGLGLAVVHGIVNQMKGKIQVDSQPGKGTRFEVYFPRVVKVPLDQTDSKASQKKLQGGTERILFLDDEPDIAELGGLNLEMLGYQVDCYSSSIKALSDFTNSPDAWDLIITDMTMPKMTGTHFAQKCFEIKKEIPIILCTGFSDLIDEQKAKELGLKKFIMKPIQKDELARAVREVLGKPLD